MVRKTVKKIPKNCLTAGLGLNPLGKFRRSLSSTVVWERYPLRVSAIWGVSVVEWLGRWTRDSTVLSSIPAAAATDTDTG